MKKKTENKKVQNEKKQTKKTQVKKTPEKEAVKEKGTNKFINIIKKKWLIQGTTTAMLVLAIVAVYIAITLVLHNIDGLAPIDLSQEQLYTLSDEVKEKIKNANIEQDVNIYFVGTSDDDANVDLAKQFTGVNEHIKTEVVKVDERPDLAQKYGLEDDTSAQGIIIESGEKSKVLTVADLSTYDTNTGETMSIADQKLATSIIAVTSSKIPKVYFLEGYSNYSLTTNMNYLSMFLANEVTQIDTLDILTAGQIPDDCDTLVVTTPQKDFDEMTTAAILNYIYKGKNILWFNSAVTQEQDMPNVNKILAEYGVKPFDIGLIRETDDKKIVTVDNKPRYNIIIPDNEKATRNIYNTTGVRLVNSTKINLEDESVLEEKQITSNKLLEASGTSYFRTDFENDDQNKEEGEAQGPFTVGVEQVKRIKEASEEEGTPEVKSKLIIYGENNFITDYPLSNSYQTGIIQYEQNRILPIDSIAYLVERDDDIVSRKDTGTVTTAYSLTQTQSVIIMAVIFTVPVLIVLTGIIVWQVRRRKK